MSGKRETRLARQGELPVSYSSMDLYRRCPRRWYFQKVEGLPSDTGLPAELGQAIHSWFEQRLQGGSPTFPALPLGAGIAFKGLVDQAEAVVAEIQQELVFGGEVHVERPLSWEYQVGATRVACMCIPDLMLVQGQRAIIWDYKSGFKMQRPRRGHPDPEEDQGPDSGGSVQGLFEALGAHEALGVREVEFRVEMVRWARSLTAEYDQRDILEFRDDVLRLATDMAQDTTWEPRPGDECRLCPYSLGKCDVGTRFASGDVQLGPRGVALPPVMLANREQAEQVAAFTLFADEGVTRKMKAWLNDWTDQNGAAFVGRGAYGHWPRYERTVPNLPEFVATLAGPRAEAALRSLIQALGEAGIDHHTILRPDIKALESYIWGRKRIPGLAGQVVKVPDEYFGFRKEAVED